MALLYDAAIVWNNLLDTSYQFTYGKNRKLHVVSLSFMEEHFFHMSGIHYIKDVDFKKTFKKTDFLKLVLTNKIDPTIIEKSSSWVDIKGRLEAIIKLEEILDSDFEFYQFNSRYLPFYSDLNAKYMIRDTVTNKVIFLFIDGQTDSFYCKSIFTMTNRDYSLGQRKIRLLEKCKHTAECNHR